MTGRTLGALLEAGTKILRQAGIGEAGLDAWLLLEYMTGKNRAYYYAHPEETVPADTEKKYLACIRRRAGHVPLQHITRQAFFMGFEFYVDENVLIPRQDTEILAEEALQAVRAVENPRILDMCTGSGCILISLLLEKKGSVGVGADISPEALRVAEKNAGRLHVADRAEFVESNLFSAPFFCKKGGNAVEKYDILVSNPPYIPTADIETLMEEVRLHDPRAALDGHEDGLDFYRSITGAAGEYLKPGGWLLYETGCGQGGAVAKLLRAAGFAQVEIKQDLAGLDRVVLGRLP